MTWQSLIALRVPYWYCHCLLILHVRAKTCILTENLKPPHVLGKTFDWYLLTSKSQGLLFVSLIVQWQSYLYSCLACLPAEAHFDQPRHPAKTVKDNFPQLHMSCQTNDTLWCALPAEVPSWTAKVQRSLLGRCFRTDQWHWGNKSSI